MQQKNPHPSKSEAAVEPSVDQLMAVADFVQVSDAVTLHAAVSTLLPFRARKGSCRRPATRASSGAVVNGVELRVSSCHMVLAFSAG